MKSWSSPGRLVVIGKRGLLDGDELLDFRHLLGKIGRDAEDLKTSRAEIPLEPAKIRELLAARHAPGRPEIDEDHSALLTRNEAPQAFRVDFPRELRRLSPRGKGNQEKEREGSEDRPFSSRDPVSQFLTLKASRRGGARTTAARSPAGCPASEERVQSYSGEVSGKVPSPSLNAP